MTIVIAGIILIAILIAYAIYHTYSVAPATTSVPTNNTTMPPSAGTDTILAQLSSSKAASDVTYTSTPIPGAPVVNAIIAGESHLISPDIMVVPAARFINGVATVPTPYRYTRMNVPIITPSIKSRIMMESPGVKKGVIAFTPSSTITVAVLTPNPVTNVTISPYDG